MAMYLSSATIKGAVDRMKKKGNNSRLFNYLILRRLVNTNIDSETYTIEFTGKSCRSVTDEAALIGHGDDRYYNPLDANHQNKFGFLSSRWWSNGPTDNINRWGSRVEFIERIQDAKPMRIRVHEHNIKDIIEFLQITDDNRISIIDVSIWWFRNENIERLSTDGIVNPLALEKEFCELIQLTRSECIDLFRIDKIEQINAILETASVVADPKEYLPYSEATYQVEEEEEEEEMDVKTTDTPETPQPLQIIPWNLIFFGAPGTGKSYLLNKLGVQTEDNPAGIFPRNNVRRVTFYPDYTYSQFVGSYRPFTEDGKISYHYVPGPFLQTYLDASTHPNDNFLLIIEELNRANTASIFGDIFQLLDRNASGESEYYVSVPIEMSICIEYELNRLDDNERTQIEDHYDSIMTYNDFHDTMLRELSLPPNMYIWATMNSADQGVFPMDTAFKRRWDFRYMGINEGEDATLPALKGKRLSEHTVEIAGGRANWNELRKAINVSLLDCGVSEDKLLGPFFLAPDSLSDVPYGDAGKSRFVATFENKVLLYLYEDAGKLKHNRLFQSGDATFAEICIQFEREGIGVFKQNTDKHYNVFSKVFESIEDSDSPSQVSEE